MGRIFSAERLLKSYRRKTVVSSVNLSVQQGEIVG